VHILDYSISLVCTAHGKCLLEYRNYTCSTYYME